MYFGENEKISIFKVGPNQYIVKDHPSVPVATCPGCGWYRFQHAVHGGCHGPVRAFGRGTCHHEMTYSGAAEFARVAGRFVKKCSQCNRYYASGGGKSADRLENSACPSPECKLACARNNPSSSNRCEVCGKVCLVSFTVTTGVLPDLFPDRLFVGGEHCLCPDGCLTKFKKEADRDLYHQCKEPFEECKKRIENHLAFTDDYEISRRLEEKMANTKHATLPTWDEINPLLVGWYKDPGCAMYRETGFTLYLLQLVIEFAFDCGPLPRPLVVPQMSHNRVRFKIVRRKT